MLNYWLFFGSSDIDSCEILNFGTATALLLFVVVPSLLLRRYNEVFLLLNIIYLLHIQRYDMYTYLTEAIVFIVAIFVFRGVITIYSYYKRSL